MTTKPRTYLFVFLCLAGLDCGAGSGRCANFPQKTPTHDDRFASSQVDGAAHNSAQPVGAVRAFPKPEQPKTALEFPVNPATEDIFRARVFEEPVVPVGGTPGEIENAALAAALVEYSKRTIPDDFSSLSRFLEAYPQSPWAAALLTGLGLEYYNTAYYSRALDAWTRAWALAKDATGLRERAIGDRAAGELALMYARLGRMAELETLLKAVEGRVFVGSATEKITGAREGLWNMQNRPEISFRCGPLALHRIKMAAGPQPEAMQTIFESASTQKGMSLAQVAELSKKVGLNYQMACRVKGADFIVPSVVHWKVGHYAGLTRREGDRYLLEDPTFGNTVWATRAALEAETSGYFLMPPGPLPTGWRKVEAAEGETVWGKGVTSTSDARPIAPNDPKTNPGPCKGMAVSGVHLMQVNLSLSDEPVGYSPPVGPPVRFIVRYNDREGFQPLTFTYANFGRKWTCDWLSYITDNPQSPAADVNCYLRGGGVRTFTGFNTNTQTYAYEQFDQTLLKRLAPANYEMTFRDGSKLIFSRSDGAVGTSRKVFLTQVIDPSNNTVTLAYDSNLRITGITDAIGQTTTLTYGRTNDIYKITKVTDPFGRFAGFDYDNFGRLTNITDVIGLSSRFTYESTSDFINALITPYGTNTFIRGSAGTTRWLETLYSDGSRDRVEFNQATNAAVSASEPEPNLPKGMKTFNQYLYGRNTYYWSRTACATAYGDYTKAKIFHWLHTSDLTTCSGILESTKEALERRVWYNYPGQGSASIVGAAIVGDSRLPSLVGRVLDDSTTQLYSYGYNGFGHLTNAVDPLGRTFSYVYASNGIDLLEARMTRAGKNELLFSATYNARHLPLMTVDAAGQTNTFTYNSRGQLLAETNPKNETTSYTYDTNGYLIAVDGPLPGTNDVTTATYDAFGRVRTKTDVSGYTLTFDHDALDRITRITYPDATFSQITYQRLQPSVLRDRAGRGTLLEYDPLGQMTSRTDPLGRVTQFQWCRCGSLKSLTDAMGRTTKWHTDVQSRLIAKEYGDGSKVNYFYENATSRLREVVDEKGQRSQFTYNRDNTTHSISCANAAVPTPLVTYTYDPDYERTTSMTDGTGTTSYEHIPITSTPTLGAGQLASVDGPLPNDTITYGYDELGRRISTGINGVASTMVYDAAGRVTAETNALGVFTRAYDGSSGRVVLETFPNGQTTERSYSSVLEDKVLQGITHRIGATPISDFLYGHDIAANRIVNWSQQVGVQSPFIYDFGYDAVDQLLSVSVTNAGSLVNSFAYAYDWLGNRLSEQNGSSNYVATYNALNQINTSIAPGASRTNEWDAKNRLVAVNAGSTRTEFTYDGASRLHSIRQLTNGVQASLRRFVWCDDSICEERDASGSIATKRFFDQGVKIETGPGAGSYFYTRDHLGSVRELTDSSGAVRAHYAYDPFGRRTRVAGDLEADFGFTGMLVASEAGLSLARFRAYDAELGRWLSRDLLRNAEEKEGANLYAYVGNNPINLTDRLGLMPGTSCCQEDSEYLQKLRFQCSKALEIAARNCRWASQYTSEIAVEVCANQTKDAAEYCSRTLGLIPDQAKKLLTCMADNLCEPESCQAGSRGGGGSGGGSGPFGSAGHVTGPAGPKGPWFCNVMSGVFSKCYY
jgi:RHS repeat-associated protein